MKHLNIGTCIIMSTMEGLAEKFATLRKHNFNTCQLVAWNPDIWTDENAELVKKMLEENEITVSAFWCGWKGPRVWNFYDGQLTLGLVPVEYRQMRIENLCAGADFAHKLGITDVVTHMGYIPENPYDPNFAGFCVAVRTVAQHLKKNGQWLLFETGQETPVTMLRCFEKVDCDNLGINLDTANLILYGKANPVDALDVFGKYVRNIHAKDGCYPTNGHDLGEEKKIGEGKVDFKAFFTKLHELGYNSWVTIENELDGADGALQDILDSRSYLESVINEVYGG